MPTASFEAEAACVHIAACAKETEHKGRRLHGVLTVALPRLDSCKHTWVLALLLCLLIVAILSAANVTFYA